MSTICKAVAKNERRVLTVSSLHKNIEGLQNVCLSLPSVVGAGGVGNTLQPSLSADELKKLRDSAEILCKVQQQACSQLS